MRAILVLYIFFGLGLGGVFAQNAPDCRTAVPICADRPVMGLTDGSGVIDDFDPETITQTGCLEKGSIANAAIENNTAWYVFRAGTAGELGFDVQSLPMAGGAATTAEWDFAVYGPFTETLGLCELIGSGGSEPIRCNYEVNTTAYTGVGVNPENGQEGEPFLTGSQNTYDEWLQVQPGELYYIFINNYNTNLDGDPEQFMLTFTGDAVSANETAALDCSLRDEFLGFDILACESDTEPITLSALNSIAGSDIDSVIWTVDYNDDGTIDDTLPGVGDFGGNLIVESPNTGRYYADITTISGAPQVVRDPMGILITYLAAPLLGEVIITDTNLSQDPDQNNIEFIVSGSSTYEFAINGGEFQQSTLFTDVPPGENTVIINDTNGCGTSEPIPFLVFGYPKFFTPNGDGINDSWRVLGIAPNALTGVTTFIFDRYGKLLAQLGEGDSWDGTYNGSAMPSTDYWFRFEYTSATETPVVAQTRRTHFTLKR